MTTQDDSDEDLLVAACVQFDVHRGDVAANLAAVESGLAAAAGEGVELAVLPEMWSTSFMPGFDAAVLAAAARAEQRVLELSREHDMVVVGSSVESADGQFFNCARVYDRGAIAGTYRKIHMFSPIAEHRYHTPGSRPLLVDTSAGKLGVAICYDLRFPDLSRHYFRMGAEILVVPAQWPEARSQHWRTLLRARAIENEIFVIGCNRTGQEGSLKNEDLLTFPGDGRIVDPTGEVLAAGSGDPGVLTAELELRTVRTMRRMLPIARDERPAVYRQLFDEAWTAMQQASREGEEPPAAQ